MYTEPEEQNDWFHTYVARVTSGTRRSAQPGIKYQCPCCGYPTLTTRGDDEICRLCSWQDDGQDDPYADENWGGPNSGHSLTEARENFKRYWVIFTPGYDSRMSGGDSEMNLTAKRILTTAFDALPNADDSERARLLETIGEIETFLEQEASQSFRHMRGFMND